MRFIVFAALLAVQPAGVSIVFDEASARELMQWRRDFDEAERAAIREFDAAIGPHRARFAVPMGHYQSQRATGEIGEHQWTAEQRRRAAAAWPRRRQKIDDAEKILSAKTVSVLKRYGYMPDNLPPVRRRKWDGPAEFGFDAQRGGADPHSRAILQALRRTWARSAREPR